MAPQQDIKRFNSSTYADTYLQIMEEGKAEPGLTAAQELQDAVCARLTKDGALDSIRRKVGPAVVPCGGTEGRAASRSRALHRCFCAFAHGSRCFLAIPSPAPALYLPWFRWWT
jgi:hypothetical protein